MNKTGFNLGTNFEYFDDLFVGFQLPHLLKKLKLIVPHLLGKNLKKEIILIVF